MRHEFSEDTKRIIAARVGYKCSNPECGALTSGPQIDPAKSLNIGVAAHITAASVGGPRYNPLLSIEERKHANNGVWLCQNCAKLIDNDESRFPETLLRQWKEAAEASALSLVGKIAGHSIQHEEQKGGEQLDDQTKLMERIFADQQAIKQRLGLDLPPAVVSNNIEESFKAASRGSMFGHGGLCSGYNLRPLPDHYFVAQEFGARRDDLRAALAEALQDFGVQPICADDSLWPGHILCKTSALIQGTPFGVYQLTVNANRNVYLELGIAIGLGRPFILVKDIDAEIPTLAQGLEYFPINSYLELRYEIGNKVRFFLTNSDQYRPQLLPEPGSQRTAIISSGGLDTLDFCIAIGRAVTRYGLTPTFLGDETGKLSQYLQREGITHVLLGREGQLQLDETVKAIQDARLGIYRIEMNASPDSFLALGVSIGLNRPGFLIHSRGRDVPSDVAGINALGFSSFAELNKTFQAAFDHLLSHYC